MKTLYWLHPHFYNWMGGHQYILEVAQRLQTEYKYKIVILTAGLSSKAQQKFKSHNIETHTLLGLSTFSPFYWIFLPFFLILEVALLKWKFRVPQNAVIISSMFPATFLARMITKRNLILCYEPFAFFYDQNFLTGFSLPVRGFFKLMNFIYGPLDKYALFQAKAVITLSKYNQKWIRKCYGLATAAVAYEGVNTHFFKPTRGKKIRTKYKAHKVIFHSTDYTKIKGTEYLINALPLVKKEVPNVRLVISETLPNSPNKKKIIDLIKKLKLSKAVEFSGFIDYELLPEYFSVAKVVVQPSIQQSMNMTVKEAMACGTAIITSPEGDEQTAHGEAGYLVDPLNTPLLAKHIVKCLKTDRMVSMMGKRGLSIIRKKFSWEAVTQVFANKLKAI
jgi:glycosyltransferase involved in cell wall biosynthesis